MPKGIVIMSGGMDSTTLAYDLLEKEEDIDIISFNYGQRHKKELEYALDTALELSIRFDIIDLSSVGFLLADGGSSLVDAKTEVPEGHYAEDNMSVTVVPNRNMMMIAVASSIAVARGANYVATGVHAGDHFQYPDCRPEFISMVSATTVLANLGFAKPGFAVLAPYVDKTKAEIASIGHQLGVKWEHTWSCYKGEQLHCGRCGTCVERAEAFYLAEVHDPTEYADPDFWKTVTK